MAGNWARTGRVQDRQLPRLVSGQQRRRRTPTTPSTTSASAPASTGTWAARASTRTGTAPPPEAYQLGRARRRRTHWPADQEAGTITYPVVWADIELPGIAPAPDNGWNSVYTSPCSGMVKQSSRPGDRRPGGVQRVRRLHHRALDVQGRRLLLGPRSGPSIFGTGSAPRYPEHLRVDLLAGDLATCQRDPTAGACAGTSTVRAVLRRAVHGRASTR